MLFVVDCCLKSENPIILLVDFGWMRLLQKIGAEINGDLKVNNEILQVVLA